jgi:hypothetical protein
MKSATASRVEQVRSEVDELKDIMVRNIGRYQSYLVHDLLLLLLPLVALLLPMVATQSQKTIWRKTIG